ncbi:hypothetical protein [Halocatena halophila]
MSAHRGESTHEQTDRKRYLEGQHQASVPRIASVGDSIAENSQ